MGREKFEIGNKVKVVKLTRGEDYYGYFKGYTPKEIPLGSKGVIVQIANEGWQSYHGLPKREGTTYYVRIKQKTYYLTSKELALDLDETESEDIESRNLIKLINEKEPANRAVIRGKKQTKREQKPFEPKFNVREEFAVWIRQEFPGLKEHARDGQEYKALFKRRKEVLAGVKQAYQHALKNTTTCIRNQFKQVYWPSRDEFLFEDSISGHLEDFVELIENVSLNLPSRDKSHGIKLKIGKAK